MAPTSDLDRLAEFLAPFRRLFVLTGAGCSTESGIPDYRDVDGSWKHKQPMRYQEFVGSAAARRRYWSRSLVGWKRIADARPNGAHQALARLESAERIRCLVTQNVDRLHSKAGSNGVIDLHGRLDRVECLDCRSGYRREAFQGELERLNPDWGASAPATIRPDGDADLGDRNEEAFRVPACPRCAGVLKPGVVFFGESVPRRRVERAYEALESADAVLVAGSSLMVYSGYRFVRRAVELGRPVVALSLGRTRADGEVSLKISARCGEILPPLVDRLADRA